MKKLAFSILGGAVIVVLLSMFLSSRGSKERAVKALEEVEGVVFVSGGNVVLDRPWSQSDSKKVVRLLKRIRPGGLELREADPEKRPEPDFETLDFLKDLGEVDSIKAVRLLDCRGLKSVEGLQALSALESLIIESFAGWGHPMKSWEPSFVPDGLTGIELPSLRNLMLQQCGPVQDLDLGGFPALEALVLRSVTVSEVNGLDRLSDLDSLYVKGCWGLKALDASGPGVLETVELNCPELELLRIKIKSLDFKYGQLAIRELDLSGSPALQDVNFVGATPNLEKINLSGCTGLRDVSALRGKSALRSIDITGCTALPSDIRETLKEWHPDAEIIGGEE